jgi:hypothetical protein
MRSTNSTPALWASVEKTWPHEQSQMKECTMASYPIYQFYAVLDGYKPKIWRQFQIQGNVSFARLAYVVMTLFEMRASHLFAIKVPYWENMKKSFSLKESDQNKEQLFEEIFGDLPRVLRYELPFENEPFDNFGDETVEISDASIEKIAKTIKSVGDQLKVNYDFGDNWWVSLTLESITHDAALPGKELPRVLQGEGYGIMEDCGGVFGLDELTKAFKRKKGERYEEYSEWLGVTEWDMAKFDMDDMNFRLKKIPRIYKQIYEDHLEPTRRSIKLLERAYLELK